MNSTLCNLSLQFLLHNVLPIKHWMMPRGTTSNPGVVRSVTILVFLTYPLTGMELNGTGSRVQREQDWPETNKLQEEAFVEHGDLDG